MRIENKLRGDLSTKRRRAQRQCDIWGMITEGGTIWGEGGPAIGGAEGRGGERGSKLLWVDIWPMVFHDCKNLTKKKERETVQVFIFGNSLYHFIHASSICLLHMPWRVGCSSAVEALDQPSPFPYDPVTRPASITNDREPLFAHCCSLMNLLWSFVQNSCLFKKNN